MQVNRGVWGASGSLKGSLNEGLSPSPFREMLDVAGYVELAGAGGHFRCVRVDGPELLRHDPDSWRIVVLHGVFLARRQKKTPEAGGCGGSRARARDRSG